jgi:hypothetical protein
MSEIHGNGSKPVFAPDLGALDYIATLEELP